MGNYKNVPLLMAARKDNCTCLFLQKYDLWIDKAYKDNCITKAAASKLMICKVCFKQNIGHSGKTTNVCGVHGHRKTM